MRKLSRIEKIRSLDIIPGADNIEVATIQSWKVVTQKGLHKIDDEVIFCEIDCFLPVREEFEFLRKSCYRTMADGSEGFRLKTIALRGQISQGLILPKSILGESASKFSVGDEVTDALGIVKFEPPIPACLEGEVKGMFPGFIPKTDEERIQNLTDRYQEFLLEEFYVTEKLDGTSATYYFRDGEFGVCSRGLDLLESETNSFWKVARALKIEESLRALNKNVAIQGELIGEGIQGNLYKLTGQTLRVFNVFDIDTYQYFPFYEFKKFVEERNLTTVPILELNFKLHDSIDDLLKFAEGDSVLNSKQTREGIVLRSKGENRISFKVISNKFLKTNE